MLERFKNYSSYTILLLICLVLIIPSAFASKDSIIINLIIQQRASYVTSCDFDGNGLKDVIAADDKTITIFLQQPNLSFKPYHIQTKERIIALNPFRTGEGNKENIICMGENKIFYFYWNPKGEIEGPNYIKTGSSQQEFLEKQKNIKNFSFIFDLNNDGLDDIIIPTNDNLLIIWQIEPLIFKTYLVKLENDSTSTKLNMRRWPKIGNKELTSGFSFFPTYTKKIDYWFQDYNNDKLLDIITVNESSDNPEINIYLQQKNMIFETPHRIQFQKTNFQQFNASNLRFIDLNNDGLLEIIETDIENPLENTNSLLPLLIIKTYYPTNQYNFNLTPKGLFKSVLMPGLINIIDLDNDGFYEFISATSPLRLSSKESIIKAITNKELIFSLRYFKFDKSMQNIELNKGFSIILPDLTSLGNFKQFVRIEDIDGNGIPDILILKKTNLLEINLLEIKKERVSVKDELQIILPYLISEMESSDIDSDGKKEFLTIDSSGKILSVIKPKGI